MRPDQTLTAGRADASWRHALGVAWLIVGLCLFAVLASITASREPDYSLAVQTAECRRIAPDGAVGAEKTVHLPFVEASRPAHVRRGLQCDFELRLTADEVRDAAMLIPTFADSISVEVNGRRVAVADLYMMRDLRFATLPAFFPNMGDVLERGDNRFRVTVTTLPGRAVALDRIFIGEKSRLEPAYHARWLTAAVIPTVAIGAEIALACMFGLIWVARPREAEFGWIAAALGLAALRGSVLMPDFGLDFLERPYWNVLVIWEAAAVLMFCRALTGASSRPWTWLLAIPPLAVTLMFIASPPADVAYWTLLGSVGVIGLYFTAATLTLIRAALRGDRDAMMVAPGLVMLLVFGARDFVMALNADPARVFLLRAAYTGFLATVATFMTLRFIQAMRKVDATAVMLRQRVAEVEAELRGTYEELRARREAEAVERERARLMRDLHDGLGGELASILALADAVTPSSREIAGHARAALADMRLIISSLEDYGGDLSLVLGAWRERAEPQLRAAGLRLIWNVGDVPQLEMLGPAQALDVLRIVQEAATNVIKHANATRLRVDVSGQGEGVAVAICDDGETFAPAGGGDGIRNMRARAARLGAELTIGREAGETCVRLLLPRATAPQSIRQEPVP